MVSNQSLNHLLNFTLPPRQSHQGQNLPRRRKIATHQGVWNKERFVNAQYRFVMNPSGDYTVHFADPDIFFQWHDILQVIVPRTSAIASAAGPGEQAVHEEGNTACPICLSPPTAPRMTKCGHVFCFPCILHYLNTSDNLKWVRCPICFDSVNERQLKSVKWFDESMAVDETDEPRAEASSSSSTIDHDFGTPFPGSTIPLPRSQTWPSDLLPPHQAPFHFLPDVFPFAKFMLATPSYLVADLTRDLDDLSVERRILASMHDDLGISFVDAADGKLRRQIAKAMALETPQLKEAVDNALHVQQQLQDRFLLQDQRRRDDSARAAPPLEDVPLDFLATQSSGFSSPIISQAPTPVPKPVTRSSTPTRNPRQRRNLNPPPPSTSTYYYYQAATGMPILLSHFSNYAAFPDTITVRVDSFAESTVNDELRKRCKYLAHLPEGADVVFVEADLAGVVGAEGLKSFEVPLRMRRARRKEKGRKDDKARARAEEREKEKLAPVWRDHVVPPSVRPPSPVEVEEIPEQAVAPPPQQAGAWGVRSFASAANAAQTPAASGQRPVRRDRERDEDEWDLDAAFHEMESRGNRGGGKKRNNRLLVLGGGGGGRRR
ncbi:hypothetical protein B0H21DRAFT_720440 [Amylocystis lapponica]|nr:hypothetical protein B0H21DRAFT_720440 [Amylocystis lapponica]